MAKGPFAENKGRQNYQKEQYAEICDKTAHMSNGKAVCGPVEKIDLFVTTALGGKDGNCPDPGNPDQPFNVITFGNLFVSGQKYRFLASRPGANPAAVGSAQQQGAQEHEDEHDEAAVYDAVHGGPYSTT